jgi:hypothetical protein
MVKVEVADPDLYQMLDAPLTRSKCKVLDLDEQLHPYPPAFFFFFFLDLFYTACKP